MVTPYIHRMVDGRKTYEHVLLVEQAIGRKLVSPEEVHHVDGNGRNNALTNLVLCPDRAYHLLLHRRSDAMHACGNASWRRCTFCQVYDAPENLHIQPNGRQPYHNSCNAAYTKARRKAK